MRTKKFALSVLAAVAVTAAFSPGAAVAAPARAEAPAASAAARTYSYDFSSSAQGWTADFADYYEINGDMELDSGVRRLPTGSGNGFYMQGHNRSDDLFMFLKRRLGPQDGIVAGRRYSVRSAVTLWSHEPACIGAGGSGGGSQYVKAGASTAEPTVSRDDEGLYSVRLDKGNQAGTGTESTLLGNAANGRDCGDHTWVKITRTSSETLTVQADAAGYLWLHVGTDSGFEGLNQLYYSTVAVTLNAL